jgi:DNA polymerase-1
MPELQQFAEDLKRLARKSLSVGTMGGRHRPLPNIRSSNNAERAKAERQSVNSVVQGSAADLMKGACTRAAACAAALPMPRDTR